MAKTKKPKKAKPAALEPWKQFLQELNPECLTCDDFDEAIMGYVERCGSPALVCYDAEKMAQILASQFLADELKRGKSNGEAQDDALTAAWEYLDFNTFGSFVGENTPMFFYRFPPGSEPPGVKKAG